MFTQEKLHKILLALTIVALLLTACGPRPTPVAIEKKVVETVVVEKVVEVEKEVEVIVEVTPVPEKQEPLKFCAAFPTPRSEPWVGRVDEAILWAKEQGLVTYEMVQDEIGYGGELKTVLRSMASSGRCDAIFVDAFLQEDLVREVAAEYPEVAFILGSEGGPVEPNVSVFDNWVQDAAYLAGIIAGGMTDSNEIAAVAAIPIGEVNRILHAFVMGVHKVNPQATIRTAFIGSWFDVAEAQKAAAAIHLYGADVFFAERAGVIEWVCDNEIGWAIGNMADQNDLCPERVLSSVTWNMRGTVEYVVEQIQAGSYTAQDLKDFNMMFKGGAALAPFYELEDEIAARTIVVDDQEWSLLDYVRETETAILDGTFRVLINESPPPAVAEPVE